MFDYLGAYIHSNKLGGKDEQLRAEVERIKKIQDTHADKIVTLEINHAKLLMLNCRKD